MIPSIQVKDNFLDQKELNILTDNLSKIYLQAIQMDDNKGNFGFRHFFKQDENNKWLFDKIKQQFFPNTNLKIDHSSYHLRHNSKTVLKHVDDQDYNFLLYLKGKELVYNGTGFYSKDNLNTYVGFVENRALFFDGKNNPHTDLQALGESSPRYTINIFYNDEE